MTSYHLTRNRGVPFRHPLILVLLLALADLSSACSASSNAGQSLPSRSTPISTSTQGHKGMITEFHTPTSLSFPKFITVGSDGNLWFTEFSNPNIGRITTNGTITEFPTPRNSYEIEGITAGPDGNLWFTENIDKVGRISTSGTITEFPLPTSKSYPVGIAAGPDGNLWFTEFGGNKIGRITNGK